jgi:hypothetical protein
MEYLKQATQHCLEPSTSEKYHKTRIEMAQKKQFLKQKPENSACLPSWNECVSHYFSARNAMDS